MRTPVYNPNPNANVHFPSLADGAPPVQPLPVSAVRQTVAARFERHDFSRIVALLTSFLVANSKFGMLDSDSLDASDDPHANPDTFRICYRLDVRYFAGVDITLDEHLFALMRASRRGRSNMRQSIAITTEFNHQTDRGLREVWSALVISVSRHATKKECLQQVKQMLLFVLRPGNIRPLEARELHALGRLRSMK